MTTTKLTQPFWYPLLLRLGTVYALLNGIWLVCAALLLGADVENLFYRAVSFRFEAWLFGISAAIASLRALLLFLCNRKKTVSKALRTDGFLGFVRRMLLTATTLLLFFTLVSFFYLDAYGTAAHTEITNLYLIGISLKLYLMILLFALAFTALSYLFRAAMLHPLVKLLLHYIGVTVSATTLELTLGKGLPEAKDKGVALIVFTVLYAIFSIGYLLLFRSKEKKSESETYTNLYHPE